jgi:hypothetical protein
VEGDARIAGSGDDCLEFHEAAGESEKRLTTEDTEKHREPLCYCASSVELCVLCG